MDPTDPSIQALFDAIKSHDLPALTQALESWSNLNRVTRKGKTPLWVAVRKNNLSACEALLAAGADPLVRGERSIDPIDLAAEQRNPALLALLLRYTSLATALRKLRGLEGVLPEAQLVQLREGLGEDEQYRLPTLKKAFIDLLIDDRLDEVHALFSAAGTLNLALSRKHSPLSLALEHGTDAHYHYLVSQGASPDYVVAGEESPGDKYARKTEARTLRQALEGEPAIQ